MCALATLALATPLAKQSKWKPVGGKRTKKSPDGIGFGRHHTSHGGGSGGGFGGGFGGSSGGGRSQSAGSGYGAAAAPVCRTVNEQECTTVNEEQCETVNDQVGQLSSNKTKSLINLIASDGWKTVLTILSYLHSRDSITSNNEDQKRK